MCWGKEFQILIEDGKNECNTSKNQLLPLAVRISYCGLLYYEQLEQVTGKNVNKVVNYFEPAS